MKTTDIDWAAGFLEGDGSFTSYNGAPVLAAYQNKVEPLLRLKSVFGVGNITGPAGNNIYSWRITNKRDYEFVVGLIRTQITEFKLGFPHEIDDPTWAWASGFFEAEGWSGVKKVGSLRYDRLSIQQKNVEALERFSAVTGGKIYGPNKRGHFSLEMTGRKATTTLHKLAENVCSWKHGKVFDGLTTSSEGMALLEDDD